MGLFQKQTVTNRQMAKESIVLVCKCTQHDKKFCIRLDSYNHSLLWTIMVAFPYETQMASENYEDNSKHFTGKIVNSDKYNGCPYCSSKYTQFCNCGNVFDTPRMGKLTCPWCNTIDNYSPGETFNFGGNAF